MNHRLKRIRLGLGLGCALLLAGCASADHAMPVTPPTARIAIHASRGLNPDNNGRPSPVELWLFELKSRGSFDSASFYELYPALGKAATAGEIARTLLNVTPGDELALSHELSPDTRHLAVVAGFRDIEHSHWRALVDIPATRGKTEVDITLEAQRVGMDERISPLPQATPLLQKLVSPLWQLFKKPLPPAPALPAD